MAYWAAIRRSRGLDQKPPKHTCGNPGCHKQISFGAAYCWLCAFFAGQRVIR